MIYLIPAWYKQNSWNECEQSWYIRRTKSEYDDTVKQMQLFHRSKSWPYKLLIFSFMPNLRHFLHRQGMYRANYWSCFDAMMEIKSTKVEVYSFKDFNWPQGIDFEYTPFAISAYLRGEKYAQIEFGEDGNLIKIDLYKDGIIVCSNYYDDRGFISSSIIYNNGIATFQEYLMENGIWKLRCFFEDGHVEVNPQYKNYVILHNEKELYFQYSQLIYSNMDEVIQEVFKEYIALVDKEDIFCVATHEQHMDVIKNVLYNKKVIMSFFDKRLSIERLAKHDISYASHIVVDTYEKINQYKDIFGNEVSITDITPYDTRVDFGISQQMEMHKILLPIDNIDEDMLGAIIRILAEYVEENNRIEVHFFTRDTKYDKRQKILQFTRNVLIDNGRDEKMALEKDDNKKDFSTEMQNNKIRFFVDQCLDELAVSRCMREQRILVDLSDYPDVYLQVAAVSAAIPQIARRETKYLVHDENGKVVGSTVQLMGALRFYLDNLSNWNEAMICASEIGEKFSTRALLERWKEVIEKVEQN